MSGVRGEFHAAQIYRMEKADILSQALTTLHWGPQVAARVLGVNERTIRRWLAGQNDPPAEVLAWILDLARYHEAHPPPRRR